MASGPSPNGDVHQRFLRGVMSRYAPHFLLWGILLAIGLGLGLLGLFRPNAGTLLPGILFFVGSFAALIPLFVGLSCGPRRAWVTADGLHWQDNHGERHCRWKDIAAVFRLDEIINQTFRVKQLRVVRPEGEEVVFDQCLSDYDQLADTVQQTVAQQLLPTKRSELTNAGAEFGPVTLHRDRITIKGKTFPWSELEQYVVFRGSFVVYPTSYKGIQCEEVTLSEIPNYLVLFQLLQELGQRPTPPQQSILFTGRK